MSNSPTLSELLPTEICGRPIDRVLTEHESYLAVGPGGRSVVLKKMDAECLLQGDLHPSVRDRLTRVRGLAHTGIANLFGVERDGDKAYLMWEYVEGVRFDFYAGANHSLKQVATLARELVLAVELLHLQGIVHGALIGSNIIVTYGTAVRLTHVSPFPFTDPQADIDCLWNVLEHAAEQLGESGAGLAAVVAEARRAHLSLRQFATRLGTLIDQRDARKAEPDEAPARLKSQRRAFVGVAVAAAVGIGLGWGVWRLVQTGRLSLPDRAEAIFRAPVDR